MSCGLKLSDSGLNWLKFLSWDDGKSISMDSGNELALEVLHVINDVLAEDSESLIILLTSKAEFNISVLALRLDEFHIAS